MNDNYSAASGQGIYGGRFNTTLLGDFIAAMPSNSWAEYTGTNINEMTPRDFDGALMGILESEANKPLTNWCNKFNFDPQMMVVSGVGTAEGFITTPEGRFRSKEVIFDMKTNRFTVKWNPTDKREGHCYDSNISLPINNAIYRRGYSNSVNISKRMLNSDQWLDTTYGVSGLPSPSPTELWALDAIPSMGASGSLLLLEASGRLIRYDLATDARTVIGTFSGVGRYPVCIRVNDHVIFGCGESAVNLYKIDGSENVSVLSNSIPVEIQINSYSKLMPSPSGDNAAYSFTNSDAKVRRLDTASGSWSVVTDYPSTLATSVAVAITSLQGLGAFAFWKGRGRITGGPTQSEFWIYKV